MIFLAKNFSYKGALVGFIIGASIGLGMLNFSIAFNLGLIVAVIFGFRKSLNQSPATKKVTDVL